MRVIVLGGTRFIGRALVEDLVDEGHDVLVCHRGEVEPEGFPDVEHVHALRKDLATVADRLQAFRPDGVVDMLAMSRPGAQVALDALPGDLPRVVCSSIDVYRAYGALLAGGETDAVPFNEDDRVRPDLYPYRAMMPGADDYEKLDVEAEYLARGGIVCRLPMVYGPRDGQRREEFILRRVRAGRDRIPFGGGQWLSSRGYVTDVARGLRLALTSGLEREIFNICERRSPSMQMWARQILDAAGSKAELVRVPDDKLPEDLGETGTVSQHLLADGAKARALLGYTELSHEEATRLSVAWHLANPPAEPNLDFSADDEALAAA